MPVSTTRLIGIQSHVHRTAPASEPGPDLDELRGRIVEVTGAADSARTSLAVRLIGQAQRTGETAAWVQPAQGTFYPPDLHGSAVDVEALVVVRPHAPPDDLAAVTRALLKAADLLLRSGAFGLVVLDLTVACRPTDGQLGRLLGLAQRHQAVLLCLTGRDNAVSPLGSLVSMRIEVQRQRRADGLFALVAEVTKDKRRAPGRLFEETLRAPDGIR